MTQGHAISGKEFRRRAGGTCLVELGIARSSDVDWRRRCVVVLVHVSKINQLKMWCITQVQQAFLRTQSGAYGSVLSSAKSKFEEKFIES